MEDKTIDPLTYNFYIYTVNQLREIAKVNNLDISGAKTKSEIVNKIRSSLLSRRKNLTDELSQEGFDKLPNELIIQILMNLDVKDILKLCQTNKRVADICQSNYLWKKLVARDFPDSFYIFGSQYPDYRQAYESSAYYRKRSIMREEQQRKTMEAIRNLLSNIHI